MGPSEINTYIKYLNPSCGHRIRGRHEGEFMFVGDIYFKKTHRQDRSVGDPHRGMEKDKDTLKSILKQWFER